MKSKTKKIIFSITIAFAVLLHTVCFTAWIVCKVLLDEMFGRVSYDISLTTSFSADDIDIEKREIELKSNNNTLRGYVWGSVNNEKLIVISHGLGGSSNDYFPEMINFVDNGYRVLTFDNTGTMSSDGKGTTGLSQSAVDLHNALKFVENDLELKNLPVYLFGHSWGGHAVTAVLNYGHDVKAVVSVAGYNSNSGIMLEWMKNSMGMGGFAYVVYPFAAGWAMTDAHGAYNYTGVKGINKSNVPVLIVQGGQDDTVWLDSLYNHKKEIKNEKVEYYFVPDAGHNSIFNPDKDENKVYFDKINNDYHELVGQYNGNIPEDIERQFFSEIDKAQYNDVNYSLMNRVYEFLNKY